MSIPRDLGAEASRSSTEGLASATFTLVTAEGSRPHPSESSRRERHGERALRVSYLGFALSSFLVGGLIIVDPIFFFGLFGIDLGEPIVASVYGGAIVGEGLACLVGWFAPARVTGVLLYMVAYKSVVVLTLTPRLVFMDDPPIGGALIVAAWGLVAVWAAMLHPWRGEEATESSVA